MMIDDEVDAAILTALDNLRGYKPGEYPWRLHPEDRAIYRAGYAAGQAAAVPREPTRAMIIAGISSLSIPTGDYVYDARDVWSAMYDIAIKESP